MTQYNYKELLEEFCKSKNYTVNRARQLLRQEIYETDLFNCSHEEIRNLIVYKMNAGSLSSIKTYVSNLKAFYVWCKTEKQIDVADPFESIMLKPRVLEDYRIKNQKIIILRDIDIDNIAAKISRNRIYYEMLIRSFYEGMTFEELMKLKEADFHYQEGYFQTYKRKFIFSKELGRLYLQYMNEIIYVDRNNNDKLFTHLYKGSYLKESIRQPDKTVNLDIEKLSLFYAKKISDIFKEISAMSGLKINRNILFNNGFISFVEKKCDYDFKDVELLFLDSTNVTYKSDVLENFAKEFGFEMSGGFIRERYYSYVKQRYQL